MAQDLLALARQTRLAAQGLGVLDLAQRNEALMAIASALEANKDKIVEANQAGLFRRQKKMVLHQHSTLDLKLGGSKLDAAIAGDSRCD